MLDKRCVFLLLLNIFRSEITFEEIQSSIQIGEEEVEEFLMDVIMTKLVRAKLAQDSGVVYVSSTMHRTFGPGEWQQLHQLLSSVTCMSRHRYNLNNLNMRR